VISELSFLLDLLFEHELPKETVKVVKDRVKDLEALRSPAPLPAAKMPSVMHTTYPKAELEQPVIQVAQTPAAAQAIASREQAIAEALSGKVNKETGRPRKF
jgi:hypothetical protein